MVHLLVMTDGRHRLAEERSLELHRLVAERLAAEPGLVDRARQRVEQWLRDGSVARRWADAWLEVLARPLAEVTLMLTDPGEPARQLRQSSPFAGVVDPHTRWAVWRRVREEFDRS